MDTTSENEIKWNIEQELAEDKRTRDLKIEVDVRDGVASLVGLVPNYALRIAAEKAVHRVEGVTDVANELVVKGRRPFSDESIAHSMRQALICDARVPDERITSTVTDGWVKIEGSVDSLSQRFNAEYAVENVAGVKGVVNEIKVVTPGIDSVQLQNKLGVALESSS